MPSSALRPRAAVVTALATALSALALVAAPPSVAAPVNDNLADAVLISAGQTLDTSTVDATTETSEPTTTAQTGCTVVKNTVWFTFTTTSAVSITLETLGESTRDTVLSIYTATTSGQYPLTAVACDDDTGPGSLSVETFAAAASGTYYVQVADYGGGSGGGAPPGPVQLRLTEQPAVPNDDATTPTVLTGNPGSIGVDTTTATHAPADPSRPNTTYRSLWYSFTADVTGTIRFEAAGVSATTPDTLLYAFPEDGPTALADALEYNDDVDEDNDDYRSRIRVDVVVGQTYRILAGTRGGHGSFDLTWQLVGTPSHPDNDDFADAAVIGTGAGDLQDSTAEPRDPDLTGSSGGHSVWYRWTAPVDNLYEFATTADGDDEMPDTVLAVFASTDFDALGEPVAFNDDADGATVGSRVVFEATAGQTYSVLVDGWPTRFRGPFILTGNQFTPDATTTTLTASPLPGVVDLAVSVTDADTGSEPGVGVVTIRDGAAVVAQLELSGGAASRRLRGVAAGVHTYTAEFVPDTVLQSGSTDAAPPVTVAARLRPGNDDFANAAVISGEEGSAPEVDLLGATREPGDVTLDAGLDGATVWYRWTAPVSDTYTFTVASGDAGASTIVGLLRGQSLANLRVLRSSDEPAGPGSEITVPAIGGLQYYVLVDAATPAPAALSWSRVGAPQRTATVLTTDTPAVYAVTLEAATTLVPGGGLAGDGTVVFLRDGVVLGAAQAVGGEASLSRTFQRPGTSAFTAEFYPTAPTVRPSASAAQSATITAPPPPDHDQFASAQVITALPSTTGTTRGATADSGTPPSALPSNADTTVWYRWVAPADGSYEFTATRNASPTDTVLRAFEGSTLATLRTLDENDDGTGIANSVVGISAVKGRTYHLAVDAYSLSGTGPYTLTWDDFEPTQSTATALTGAVNRRTVTLTATVTTPPAGRTPGFVEFFEGSVSRGRAWVTAANGRVTRTLTNVTPGAHTYRAVFVPDDYRFRQSTSANRRVTVARTATRTTLTAPSRVGRGARPVVTAVVKVGTANATGNVRFTLNGRVLRTVALRGGRASLQLPALAAGTARVIAGYLGTTLNAASSATRSIVVRR